MALRSIVRVILVLIVVGGLFTSSVAASVAAQTESRKQERLAKSSILKQSLNAVLTQQDASGGFSYPDSSVDPRTTAFVVSMMIALRNEGVSVDLDAALAYLQQTDPVKWVEAEFVSLTINEVSRIVIALIAAGGDPRNVGGNDLVAVMVESWHADTSMYGDHLYDSSQVVMALVVAGEPVEEQAIVFFASTQQDDGSWDAYGTAGPGDGLVTSFIVQALVAVGRGDDPAVDRAVEFLKSLQTEDGAFTNSPDAPADSYTSGLIISALISAGEDLKSEEWSSAVTALLGFQKENGWFERSPLNPYDDLVSTVYATVALAGAYWPVVPVS